MSSGYYQVPAQQQTAGEAEQKYAWSQIWTAVTWKTTLLLVLSALAVIGVAVLVILVSIALHEGEEIENQVGASMSSFQSSIASISDSISSFQAAAASIASFRGDLAAFKNSIQSSLTALSAAVTSAAPPPPPPPTTAPATNPFLAALPSVQLPLAPVNDQLCLDLATAPNATLRAEFCTNNQPLGQFCAAPPCLVPFTNVQSIGFTVNKNLAGNALSITALDVYYVNFVVQVSGVCPFATKILQLSLIEQASNQVLAQATINSMYAQQFCTRAVLPPGSSLAFRIDSINYASPTSLLTLTGAVSTTPDFAWLQFAGNYDGNVLKTEWIPFLPPTVINTTAYQPQTLDASVYAQPPNFPARNNSKLPWFSATIPASPPINLTPQQLAGAGLPNYNSYDKFRSVQEGVGFFIYTNFSAQAPDDPKSSVFLTNLANRGPDNFRKKVYIAALLTRVLPFYQEKMQNFIDTVYAGWTEYNKPLLSSFKPALVKFFLDIHVGVNDHPQYVLDYFDSFGEFIGYADFTMPSLYTSHVNFKRVSEYMRQRAIAVIDADDTSTITYWWNKAGFYPDNLVFEMVHNIVAFNQFNNIMFLLARDMITGTPTAGGPSIQYNFIGQYAAATNDQDRLNVVREMYRLLVPNGISFSFLNQFPPVPNQPPTQSRHVHQLIMLMNSARAANLDPSNPANWAVYYNWDLTKYAQYNTTLYSVNCPPGTPSVDSSSFDPTQPSLPEVLVSKSPVDGETVIDNCNPLATPVYPLPIYAPFGLGYRRCPGELFVYQITQMMLQRFANLHFYLGPPPPEKPAIGVAPFTVVRVTADPTSFRRVYSLLLSVTGSQRVLRQCYSVKCAHEFLFKFFPLTSQTKNNI